MFYYAKKILLKEALAEEAVQENSVTAYHRLDSFQSSSNSQGRIMSALKHVTRRVQETRHLHSRYLQLGGSALGVADTKAHH